MTDPARALLQRIVASWDEETQEDLLLLIADARDVLATPAPAPEEMVGKPVNGTLWFDPPAAAASDAEDATRYRWIVANASVVTLSDDSDRVVFYTPPSAIVRTEERINAGIDAARTLERERDEARAALAERDDWLRKKPCQLDRCVTLLAARADAERLAGALTYAASGLELAHRALEDRRWDEALLHTGHHHAKARAAIDAALRAEEAKR